MKKVLVDQALEKGKGVLRLAPTWVPRAFCRPGRRLKLHPDDYFSLGLKRGGIDERWLSSATPADNGPGTPGDEGLSYIVIDDDGKEKVMLAEAVDLLGEDLIGPQPWGKYGKWPMFSKFFDNLGPLPHHIHHRDRHAEKVGQAGKPEMYFFPAQMNNYPGEFAYTFFGFNPEVTKQQVRECLMNFEKGDNHILELSRAYKLRVDTGWDVPPGVLHAPGSLCTYEPQFSSDVYAMYQSVLFADHVTPPELLWKNMPESEYGNYDYLMDVIDWERNIDPDFAQKHFMPPIRINNRDEQPGLIEEWICYKCDQVSAQRLTLYPDSSAVIKDEAAYGLILIQGHGSINGQIMETPSMIRYGQLTRDEFFVSHHAAKQGVTLVNNALSEPLVLLKHFAENPEIPIT